MPLLPVRPSKVNVPEVASQLPSGAERAVFIAQASRDQTEAYQTASQAGEKVAGIAQEIAYGNQRLDISNKINEYKKKLDTANTFEEAEKLDKEIQGYNEQLSQSAEGVFGLPGNAASRDGLNQARALGELSANNRRQSAITNAEAINTALAIETNKTARADMRTDFSEIERDPVQARNQAQHAVISSFYELRNQADLRNESINRTRNEVGIELTEQERDIETFKSHSAVTEFVLANATDESLIDLLHPGQRPDESDVDWANRAQILKENVIPYVGEQGLIEGYEKAFTAQRATEAIEEKKYRERIHADLMAYRKGQFTPRQQTLFDLYKDRNGGVAPTQVQFVAMHGRPEDFPNDGSSFFPAGANVPYQGLEYRKVLAAMEALGEQSKAEQEAAVKLFSLKAFHEGNSIETPLITEASNDYDKQLNDFISGASQKEEDDFREVWGFMTPDLGQNIRGPAFWQKFFMNLYGRTRHPITDTAIASAKSALASSEPGRALYGAAYVSSIRSAGNKWEEKKRSLGEKGGFSVSEIDRASSIMRKLSQGNVEELSREVTEGVEQKLQPFQVIKWSEELKTDPTEEAITDELSNMMLGIDSRNFQDNGWSLLGYFPEVTGMIEKNIELLATEVAQMKDITFMIGPKLAQFYNPLGDVSQEWRKPLPGKTLEGMSLSDQLRHNIERADELREIIHTFRGPDPKGMLGNSGDQEAMYGSNAYKEAARSVIGHVLRNSGDIPVEELAERASEIMAANHWSPTRDAQNKSWIWSQGAPENNPSFYGSSLSSNKRGMLARRQIATSLKLWYGRNFYLHRLKLMPPVEGLKQTSPQGHIIYHAKYKDHDTGNWETIKDKDGSGRPQRFTPHWGISDEALDAEDAKKILFDEANVAAGHDSYFPEKVPVASQSAWESQMESVTDSELGEGIAWGVASFMSVFMDDPRLSDFSRFSDEFGEAPMVWNQLPLVMDMLYANNVNNMASYKNLHGADELADRYSPKTQSDFHEFIKSILPNTILEASPDGTEIIDGIRYRWLDPKDTWTLYQSLEKELNRQMQHPLEPLRLKPGMATPPS